MIFVEKKQQDGTSNYLIYDEYSEEDFDCTWSSYTGCLEFCDDSWYRVRLVDNLLDVYELGIISSKLSELNHELWQATQDILKSLKETN